MEWMIQREEEFQVFVLLPGKVIVNETGEEGGFNNHKLQYGIAVLESKEEEGIFNFTN